MLPAVLAAVVATGAGAAAAAVALRHLIPLITLAVTGHRDFGGPGAQAHGTLPALGGWFVVLVPVLGALIYGPLLQRFAPDTDGLGIPDAVRAAGADPRGFSVRVAAVRGLASAVSIGTGGGTGRDGPAVAVGAGIGASLGRRCGLSDPTVRMLMGCGAAGALAGMFGTPTAGVAFALELGLVTPSVAVAAALVLAAAAGRLTAVGLDTVLQPGAAEAVLGVPPQAVAAAPHGPVGLLSCAVLGLVAALAGTGFSRAIYDLTALADGVWRGPPWLRPVVGSVALGGLLLVLPALFGTGQAVLHAGLLGGTGLVVLLVLTAGKVLATSLTLAIGGSGGVFLPTLFVGGLGGTAFGEAATAVAPQLGVSPGAYGVLGMAAVLASATRAPVTAVLLLLEITAAPAFVPPLVVAVASSALLSRALSPCSVYTRKPRT